MCFIDLLHVCYGCQVNRIKTNTFFVVKTKKHESIDYIEFSSGDLPATKSFFEAVFGWSFQDYGAEYTAFSTPNLDGGFFKADKQASTANGSALAIFYSNNLEATQSMIEEAGGQIVKPIFDFPGGRRFHFTEPGGNELAVWSDR